MEKIFGIGWAKTGTKTLGKCFEILGFSHVSRRLDLVKAVEKGNLSKIFKVVQKGDTFEDWPWIILYKELDTKFPESKFILTKRDEKQWLKSYRNLLKNEGKPTKKKNRIRSFLYGLPFPDVTDEDLLERYRRHNFEVQQYFSSNPNKLLVVNWEEGDGWNELCKFLELSIPEVELPHLNRGKYHK